MWARSPAELTDLRRTYICVEADKADSVYREGRTRRTTRRAAGRMQEPKGVSCFCCVTQITTAMIDYVALNMAVV